MEERDELIERMVQSFTIIMENSKNIHKSNDAIMSMFHELVNWFTIPNTTTKEGR